MRRLLLACRLPNSYWTYAMRYWAELLRHETLGFPCNIPAFGEEIGVWRSHDQKLAKASDLKGAVGRVLHVALWGDGTCILLKKGCDPDDPDFMYGLQENGATKSIGALRSEAQNRRKNPRMSSPASHYPPNFRIHPLNWLSATAISLAVFGGLI